MSAVSTRLSAPVVSEAYAVDTTQLLCANSALFPTKRSNLRDRECDGAFADFVTYLTNGCEFGYVRPAVTQPVQRFPILDLLASASGRPKNVYLTPDGEQATWNSAAVDFAQYLPTRGPDVAHWTRFQFDDLELIRVFFDGGPIGQLDKLAKSIEVLQRLPNFVEIQGLWKASGGHQVVLRGLHLKNMGAITNDPTQYALAYAFFGFAKGHFYPLQMSDRPRHCMHWLRRDAFRFLTRRLAGSNATVEYSQEIRDPEHLGLCFRWGNILLEIAKTDERLRSINQLLNVIGILRTETTKDVLRGLTSEVSRKGASVGKAACEDFVLQTLARADWRPAARESHYSRAKRIERAVKIATGSLLPLWGPWGVLAAMSILGAAEFKFIVDSKWYEAADFQMYHTFFRERLFERYKRDEIGASVDAFVAAANRDAVRKRLNRSRVLKRRKSERQ